MDKMESRFRKKLIMIGAAVVIVLVAAIIVLVSQSNRIMKQRLEQAMGGNFAVESLSLSWDRIELIEPRFIRDGQIAAQAKRIILKAEILALLKSGLTISGVLIEEPSLTLQIDRRGRWVLPFDAVRQTEPPPEHLSITEIEVKEGTIYFLDQRRPEPDRIEFRNIHLTLDHVFLPLRDEPSAFFFKAQLAGERISGSLGGKGTIHLKTLAVNGKFEGQNLTVGDTGTAGPAASVERTRFTAASKGTAAKGLHLTDLVLTKPYLRLETDRKGKWISPFADGPEDKEGNSMPVEVKNIKIEDGELLYLEGEVTGRAEPDRIEFRNIRLTLDHASWPFRDESSAFTVQAQLAGNRLTGSANGQGTIHLQTLAVDGKFEGHNLTVPDGGTAGPPFRAQSASFTAASKGTAAKGLHLTDLVLTKPYLRLEKDRKGKWISPFAGGSPKARTKEKEDPAAPVEVKNLKIEDGELLYLDGKVTRRPEPDRIECRKIVLTLDHASWPFRDEPSAFAVQAQFDGNMVTGSASGTGNIHLGTLAVNGKFEGQNLIVLYGGTAGPPFRAQNASFTAVSKGTAAKGLHLSDLVMNKPYLRLETDRNGKIISPLWVKEEQDEPTTPVEVKNLKIDDGELLYVDGKVAREPYPVSVTAIGLTADHLSFPFGSHNTNYRLSARLPGKNGAGALTSSGSTVLKTLDTNAKVSLHDLDLTSCKPYWQKEGEVDISRGFFDLDMDLGIKTRMLSSPGRSVLKDLRFVEGRGVADRFLGLPRESVVSALTRSDNQIAFDFILEGSLDSPKYSLRENMLTRMTVGLAARLGLSVIETGGKVIIKSGELIKGAGDAVIQIFK